MQICDRCGRRKIVSFAVTPASAWERVVRDRWPYGRLCAGCFDAEAEVAQIHYFFRSISAASWSEEPPQRVAKKSLPERE